MADKQDTPLSERVVKEAVSVGMETPLRDPILEAVEESGEGDKPSKRTIPAAGALLGIGATIGYLLGREDREEGILEEVSGKMTEDTTQSTDDVTEDVGEDVTEEVGTGVEEVTADEDGESSKSRLPRLALLAGIVAGAVLIRRRLKSEDEEEWEPIEEFEPAVTVGDDSTDEESADEATIGVDETDEQAEGGDGESGGDDEE